MEDSGPKEPRGHHTLGVRCRRTIHTPEEPEGATWRCGNSPPQPRPWAAVPLTAVLLPLCRCGGSEPARLRVRAAASRAVWCGCTMYCLPMQSVPFVPHAIAHHAPCTLTYNVLDGTLYCILFRSSPPTGTGVRRPPGQPTSKQQHKSEVRAVREPLVRCQIMEAFFSAGERNSNSVSVSVN